MENLLPRAISNIDHYLLAIANGDTAKLPIPTSNAEHYLLAIAKKIAESGIGGTEEAGKDGREIELATDDDWIKWRYKGTSAWTNLIALNDLRGEFDPAKQYAELKTKNKAVLAAINELQDGKLNLTGGTMSGTITQPAVPIIEEHLVNKKYVDNTVAALVDGAPGGLDTLNKLAAALAADANLSTTLLNLIGQKLDASEVTTTPTPGKVSRLDSTGNLPANAATASRFKNPVLVNGQQWYGDTDINVSADVKIADWQPKTVYKKDDIIVYNNTLYRATQPHTSADTFTADMIPGYDKWQSLGGGSGSSSTGYSQVTKLGIIAPKQIDIPIQSTNTFCLPAIEVLKFTPGAQDQVVTACDFNNGDAGDFVASDRVTFDGTMRLKTQYEIAMSDPVALEDGFVSESEWVDFADYKVVEDVLTLGGRVPIDPLNYDKGFGAAYMSFVVPKNRKVYFEVTRESGYTLLYAAQTDIDNVNLYTYLDREGYNTGVYGLAFDIANDTVIKIKNGVSTTYTIKNMVGFRLYANGYCKFSYNFGGTPFKYAIPDGYTAYLNGGYCCYLNGNKAYAVNDGDFEVIADDWTSLTDVDKKALFLSTDHGVAAATDLATISKFKVLGYTNANDKQSMLITVVPHGQLVTPNKLIRIESYDGIDKATIASTISGNGACKIIATTDLTTYQTYDFATQTWQPIDHTDLAQVKASGINAAALQTIDRTAWDLLTTGKSGIGFAYFLSIDSTSDTCAVDKLTLQVDMRGSWDKAVHGTDYKYGYPYNTTLRVDIKTNGDYKINYCGGV